MRLLLFAGLLTGAASLATVPAGAQRTMMSAPNLSGGSQTITTDRRVTVNRGGGWGNRVNGRWSAGYQAPGGWGGYRRPVRGFVLPGFWLQPGYYIADYRAYGLPAPSDGYGWSRYYDDAVLTDRYGAVQDSRVDYAWDRYGGYDDRGYQDDGQRRDGQRDNGGRTVAGAVVGGVAGGLLGSAIAGPGDRTGGAIIGAGVGAIAGGALASATSYDGDRYDDRAGVYDPYAGEPYYTPGSYGRPDARRSNTDERRIAREEARLRKARAKESAKLDKLARKAGYPSYGAYLRSREPRGYAQAPLSTRPHWAMQGDVGRALDANSPRIEYQQLPGQVVGGYYYPGPAITTVTIPSSVTTTTTETSYVTTKAVKPIKPRPKAVGTKLLKR